MSPCCSRRRAAARQHKNKMCRVETIQWFAVLFYVISRIGLLAVVIVVVAVAVAVAVVAVVAVAAAALLDRRQMADSAPRRRSGHPLRAAITSQGYHGP